MTQRTAIAILALCALAGCGRKGARSADFDSATAAALASSPPGAPAPGQPKVSHVAGFELAHQLNRRSEVMGGTTAQFSSADSILLSVRIQYATTSVDVSARLRQNNRTVDSTGVKSGPADSTGVAIVAVRFPAIKNGHGPYQADVFLNGRFQMSKDFTISQ